MGIQHNVSARPLIDIYPGSHRRMKLSINGYQMIFSKTFPSMTNDLPHLWSVLIAQLKAWISKASYNIPLNCQWSIAFAVAACTSATLLFFQTIMYNQGVLYILSYQISTILRSRWMPINSTLFIIPSWKRSK